MTPKYIIVEGRFKEELAHHVNEAISNGYRPIGGMTIEENGYQGRWYQAMVHQSMP